MLDHPIPTVATRPSASRRREFRAGFTFVELVAVIVVLGVLAGISLVRLSYLRDRALLASMQTDLHNLLVEQEAHYIQFGIYAQIVTSDGSASPSTLVFNSSAGSTLPAISTVPGGGFIVTITNRAIVHARSCAVSAGGSTPWPRVADGLTLPSEGEIVCG